MADRVRDPDSNIWIAAGDGDLDEVRHYVEVDGVDVNVQDETGYSALCVPVHGCRPVVANRARARVAAAVDCAFNDIQLLPLPLLPRRCVFI